MAENTSYSKNLFTPRNILIYLVVAAVVYGAFYFLVMKKDSGMYQNTPMETVEDENTMTVSLGAQNDSGENGTATLTEKDGKTMVSLSVENAPSDVEQPAHIHSGACPTPGDVVYPLTNVLNGKSETVLDVDLATLKQGLPLAINVHKSGAEVSVYVSCGDLQ